MAGIRGPAYGHFWEEDECLEYYGMFSLHQMFDVIGAHMTESDMDVLSFLLEETHPFTHPMNPELWAVEDEEVQHDALVAAWQRLNRRRSGQSQGRAASEHLEASICRPRNGIELLLELERRGKCDEGNFRHILQLLRVLTRHDLLHYVTLKRPRTVSPERFTYGPSVNYEQTVDSCLNSSNAQGDHSEGSVSNKRVKAKRGRCGQATSRKRGRKARVAAKEEPTKAKVTCGRYPRLPALVSPPHVALSPLTVAGDAQQA